MKKIIFTLVMSFSYCGFAQVGINTTVPNASSMLDVSSTTKGFLQPRMTTLQRIAIVSPATGLQVYDTTTNSNWYFNGTIWVQSASTAVGSKWTNDAANSVVRLTNLSDGVTPRPGLREFLLHDNGNVGIGLQSPPQYLLDIKDTSSSTIATNIVSYVSTANTFGKIGKSMNILTAPTDATNYQNLWGDKTDIRHDGTGTINEAIAVRAVNQNASSGVVSNAIGVASFVGNESTGNITNAKALDTYVRNLSTGTITNATGLNVDIDANNITNSYGVKIPRIRGTNRWSIYASDNTAPSYFAGNVGIGTATPNAPLQFANTSANRKIVLWNSTNNDHQFYGFGINNNMLRFQTDATGSDHAFFAATSSTSSNELFRIKGNGNVGIGTSTPNAPLQFANTLINRKIVLWENANNDHQFYGFGINNNMLRFQTDATGSDHAFFAATSNTTSNELFRIKGNGNVVLGANLNTTANGPGFYFDNDYNNTDTIYFQRQNISADKSNLNLYLGDNYGSGTQYEDKFNILAPQFTGDNRTLLTINTGTTNVGIGTATPTSKLQVVGLPIHANNAAAITAGLTVGAFYHNGDGILRVVF